MKPRSTILLLLLAIGIFAYVKFYDARLATTRDVLRDANKVVSLDRDKINFIAIKNAEGTIEVRKQDNDVWVLEKPVKDRANSMVITGLFTSAEYLKFDSVIGEDKPVEKEQLKEWGLANSETKITFGGGPKPVEILFGKDAAVEGKMYIKLTDDKKVFVIANDLKNQITKKTDEFRDRKLTDLSTAQINRVAIRTAAGEIELEKKNGHWSLLKPLKARGDDAKIGDVISHATTAHIESFVADSANLAAFGLQEPRGTVSLYPEGSDKPVVLQVGGNPKEEAEKDKTYAKLSTRDAVVVLPKSIESLLGTKPNDLRDKNLLRVEEDIVDRINIEATGMDKIVLSRKGESWVRKADKDMPVDGSEATRLLNELKSQQVVGFESDVAGDLQKYGLDQPSVKVTLSSYASENTAETKAGEKPIVTVLFGGSEGNNVYAKLDEEPFIVTIPKGFLSSIATDPLQWQETTIFKYKPEDIASVEITKGEQPTVSIERDKDKWKLARGDGALNQINAQSLVNTLSSLRAIRWKGATRPEDGFDKPTVVVTFKAGGDRTGKVTIGAATADGTWNAMTDGSAGTFILSRPDEEALVLSLIDKTAAVASPAQPEPAPAAPPLPPVGNP